MLHEDELTAYTKAAKELLLNKVIQDAAKKYGARFLVNELNDLANYFTRKTTTTLVILL